MKTRHLPLLALLVAPLAAGALPAAAAAAHRRRRPPPRSRSAPPCPWADVEDEERGRPRDHPRRRRAASKGTLVVFSCNHCPWAKAWEERIVDASATPRPKQGIGVVAVNSNDPRPIPRTRSTA